MKLSNPIYTVAEVKLMDLTTNSTPYKNAVIDVLYKTKKPFEPINPFKDEDERIRSKIVCTSIDNRNGVEL